MPRLEEEYQGVPGRHEHEDRSSERGCANDLGVEAAECHHGHRDGPADQSDHDPQSRVGADDAAGFVVVRPGHRGDDEAAHAELGEEPNQAQQAEDGRERPELRSAQAARDERGSRPPEGGHEVAREGEGPRSTEQRPRRRRCRPPVALRHATCPRKPATAFANLDRNSSGVYLSAWTLIASGSNAEPSNRRSSAASSAMWSPSCSAS